MFDNFHLLFLIEIGQILPNIDQKGLNYRPYPHCWTPHPYQHLIGYKNIINYNNNKNYSDWLHQKQKKLLFVAFLFDVDVLLWFRWSAVKVPLKCHWSAIEVPTANSQQPTVTATDRHLLTPPLSTVGWSNTVIFNNLKKKKMLKLNISLFHKILIVHNFLYLWFCVILTADCIRHSFLFELFWPSDHNH